MVVGYDPSGSSTATSVPMAILAGGFSASVSRCLINPFDVLKIRIQLLPRDSNYGIQDMVRTMVRKEGPTVFWKGHIPAQLMSISHGVAQFTTYEMLSKWTGAFEPPTRYLPAIDFACGCAAGAAGTMFSNPADVVRTRVVGFPGLRYEGLFRTAMEIYRKEGPKAFFRGTLPGVLSRAPLAGLQFTFYRLFIDLYELITETIDETPTHVTALFSGAMAGLCAESLMYPLDTIKKKLIIEAIRVFNEIFLRIERMNESTSSACAGACSGCLSKAILYPLELIRRMLQVQGSSLVASVPSGSFYICAGFLHCTKTIFLKEGVFGYYKGFCLSAIKSMVGTTLHFFVYETVMSRRPAEVESEYEVEQTSMAIRTTFD